MNRQNILLVASASLATALAMLAVPAVGQLGQSAPPAAVEPVPAPQLQTERVVPASQTAIQQSFAPIVRRTAPAVVNVFSSVNITRSNCRWANTPWESQCGGDVQTRSEKVDNSLGSGVIVAADGVIVTNNHVVERPQGLREDQAQEFRVVLSDRREFPATLVMADEKTDLAVLKIETRGEALPTLAYADTRGVQVGDLVIAIGNPFGVGQTVTSGIVSALARTDVGVSDFASFIQTDAAINPGNSGGALVDMNGRLVGVNTMIFSRGGGSNGVGFAIPAEMVKRVVDAAVNGGTLIRPWLGAKGETVTTQLAAIVGLDRPRGVLISEVFPDGPAAKAGLRKGDVVLAVDGRDVFDETGMKFYAATRPAGDVVGVTVLRNGREMPISVRLAAPPGQREIDVRMVRGVNPFSGAQVLELSPALAEELGRDPFQTGVLVARVERGSYASRFVRPGDFVRELNGTTIRNARDLEAALKKIDSSAEPVWRMALERNGKRIEQTVAS